MWHLNGRISEWKEKICVKVWYSSAHSSAGSPGYQGLASQSYSRKRLFQSPLTVCAEQKELRKLSRSKNKIRKYRVYENLRKDNSERAYKSVQGMGYLSCALEVQEEQVKVKRWRVTWGEGGESQEVTESVRLRLARTEGVADKLTSALKPLPRLTKQTSQWWPVTPKWMKSISRHSAQSY